ncbi:MAG TPA: heme-binding protein [Stellaceae bacterium]|nr:heme-binding protein [Stellaceae bacterium]
MKKLVYRLVTTVAVVGLIGPGLCAVEASAQAQKPNPLDVVPDQMPFNVPYGMPISLEHAKSVIAAAAAEATKRHWDMNIAVLDSGGNLVAFERMDGAQLASISIAQHKARVAVMYRRESKAFENGIQGGNNYLLTLDDVIGARGGIPLIENGRLIGAIGCSGGTGSQDEVVAKAGAEAMK